MGVWRLFIWAKLYSPLFSLFFSHLGCPLTPPDQIPPASTPSPIITILSDLSFAFLFFFFGSTCSVWTFSSQESYLSPHYNPLPGIKPMPPQRQARSLTHFATAGTPASYFPAVLRKVILKRPLMDLLCHPFHQPKQLTWWQV